MGEYRLAGDQLRKRVMGLSLRREGMKKVVMVITMLFGIFFILSILMPGEGLCYENEKCEIPSSAVRITVKQDGDVLPVYEFTVTNLHNIPIYYIAIGWGPKGGVNIGITGKYIAIERLPLEGWEVPLNYEAEGAMFFHYQWFVYHGDNDQKYFIKPGETRSGFKLLLHKPLDYFKTAPFRVEFSRGFTEPLVCVYGTVVFEE